ncbi:MAG: iron-containing alcohol dehydrogenase, partial [Candidatus Hermodarchaeota archaeon]
MWFFLSPHLVYGEDALDFLDNIIGEKCFVVSDKILQELGLLKILTDKIDSLGKKYVLFTEVKPDPHMEDVLDAKDQCFEFEPDMIIALGGGSVMDTAKVVWCLYENPDFVPDDIHAFRNDLYDMGKKAKFVTIPTTSGTGAELTNVAVISRFEDNIWKKAFFLHKGLTANWAIIDPKFPLNMPPKLTADTGFDALSHSMECLVSLWKNEFSNGLALKSIELIFKWLPIAVKDGKNMEARDNMHQAAAMAGLAFGNAQVQIAHTLGHTWGALYHVPHGRAVGVALVYATQFALNNPDDDTAMKEYSKLAKQLGWAKWEDDDKKAAYIVIDKVKELQKQCDFPSNFKDTGISKEDFEQNLDTLVTLCFGDSS